MAATSIPPVGSSTAPSSGHLDSPPDEKAADGRIEVTLPFSEVCIYMGLAGRRMLVEPVGVGMAQLIDPLTDLPVSFPITRGEAGLA